MNEIGKYSSKKIMWVAAVYSLDLDTTQPRVRKDQENVTIDIQLSRYGSLSKDRALWNQKDTVNY